MLIVKMISLVLFGLIFIVTVGAILSREIVYTPKFKGADGKKIAESIAEFTRIKLGGYSQAVLIRGKNINNPVLLYLHAGPGLSETGMMRNMNAKLENYYTMVYLDQRGGAKSYSPFLDYSTFNKEQLVQDIHELTVYLKKRFNKDKIIIAGHSFGAGFGAYAATKYPQDYSALIVIGMPVSPCEIDRLSYKWNLEQAKQTGNKKALNELNAVNNYWLKKEQKPYFNGMMVNKKWVGHYGGQIYGKKGFLSFVLKNSLCKEFTILDYTPYMLGLMSTGPASWEIMITTDFRKQAVEYKCPVILLTGRNDFNVVPELVEDYFKMLNAPFKKHFWFEKSAHFPHFEERELFQKIMTGEVLNIIQPQTTE